MKRLIDIHNDKLCEKGIIYRAVGNYQNTLQGKNPTADYICPEGHEFTAPRYRMMMGKVECPSCGHYHKRVNHEGYLAKLKLIDTPFEPVEDFKGVTTPIIHKCKAEGHEHKIMPKQVLLNTQGCPYCSGMKKKNTVSYCDELEAKGIDKYFPVEEYITIMTKILHKCMRCSLEWSVKPHDILNGHGCPACAKSKYYEDTPVTLYYIKIWDQEKSYYKIGVTSTSIEDRMKHTRKDYRVILEVPFDCGVPAYRYEQEVLQRFNDYRVKDKNFIPQGGYAELFSCDVLGLDTA